MEIRVGEYELWDADLAHYVLYEVSTEREREVNWERTNERNKRTKNKSYLDKSNDTKMFMSMDPESAEKYPSRLHVPLRGLFPAGYI